MKKIRNFLALAFVLVGLSSCFCATYPIGYVTTPNALQREIDNAAWQAGQRAVARQQAIENEYWQRSQR